MQTDLDYLFLLPVVTALAFMIWVLWNVSKQLRSEKRTVQNERVISLDMTDKDSGRRPVARMERLEMRTR